MKNGVSTKLYTYIPGRTTKIRIPNIMHENATEQPMIIVGGVLLLIIAKTYDESQDEELANPA